MDKRSCEVKPRAFVNPAKIKLEKIGIVAQSIQVEYHRVRSILLHSLGFIESLFLSVQSGLKLGDANKEKDD